MSRQVTCRERDWCVTGRRGAARRLKRVPSSRPAWPSAEFKFDPARVRRVVPNMRAACDALIVACLALRVPNILFKMFDLLRCIRASPSYKFTI